MNEIIFLDIPNLKKTYNYIFSLYKDNEKNMKEFSSSLGNDPTLSVLKLNDKKLNLIVKNIVNDIEFNSRLFKHHRHNEHTIHKDVGGIKCALNFMIEGNDSPIVFYNDNKQKIKQFYYKCALINTEIYHSVPPSDNDRIFLRYGFYDSFDTIKNCFKKYEIFYNFNITTLSGSYDKSFSNQLA